MHVLAIYMSHTGICICYTAATATKRIDGSQPRAEARAITSIADVLRPCIDRCAGFEKRGVGGDLLGPKGVGGASGGQ